MPVFDVFKPNLALKHKQNASVGSPEPLQRKAVKKAVSRLFKFSGALQGFLEARFWRKTLKKRYFDNFLA